MKIGDTKEESDHFIQVITSRIQALELKQEKKERKNFKINESEVIKGAA